MKLSLDYKIILFSLLIFVTLSSCDNERSAIDTEIKIPVSINSLKNQSISRYIETTGTVYSSKEGTIKSDVSGIYLLKTNSQTGKPYALGDFVKKGQLLIAIQDKEFENNLQVESKKLNLELSENNLNKQKKLYEKGGVTLTELNNASIDFINAKYAYENTQIQLEKLYVRAPFDGIIVQLPYYTQGIRIDQGQELFKMMKYDRLLMDIKLPEKSLSEVYKEQQVLITNYNLAADTLLGKISQISPVIDPDTRTFQSVLVIENKDLRLRPGMFVKAAILAEKRDNTIVIPKETIISRQNMKVVFTVENGIATEKSISTGLETQDLIEVTGGLKVNDRLVIAGFETLRNKSKVNVIQ
ncbi:MAG: efflux RND transporter periplasmic adaptor subunit [Bacteroidota bacterium]